MVSGVFKNKTGTIEKPIGRVASSVRRSTAAQKMKNLKEARTDYRVIWNWHNGGPGFALLEVYPKTGRTNQIRVHLASIGHPVAGDKVYGSKKMSSPFDSDRMFLHAYLLELPLREGEVMRLEADLPEDLKKALNNFGAPSPLDTEHHI